MQAVLAEHVRKLEALFYGVTLKQLQRIAYQFAEANKISHRFNEITKTAGKKWVTNFCRKHDLSMSTRENQRRRLTGFNKRQVDIFFENLKSCISAKQFSGRSIYNIDETAVMTVPNKIYKIKVKR